MCRLPPIWLLGSSDYSAQVSAALGMGFAFARHISPDGAVGSDASLPGAVLALRRAPGAEDDPRRLGDLRRYRRARRRTGIVVGPLLLRLRSGQPGLLPSPEEAPAYPVHPERNARRLQASRARHVIGSPAVVRAQLDELIAQTGADELMVTTMVHAHAERLHSYELLAALFELLG